MTCLRRAGVRRVLVRRGSNARGIPVGVCDTRGMVWIVLRAHALLGQAKSYKLFTLARLTRAARVGTMGTIARHTDPGHTMRSEYEATRSDGSQSGTCSGSSQKVTFRPFVWALIPHSVRSYTS